MPWSKIDTAAVSSSNFPVSKSMPASRLRRRRSFPGFSRFQPCSGAANRRPAPPPLPLQAIALDMRHGKAAGATIASMPAMILQPGRSIRPAGTLVGRVPRG